VIEVADRIEQLMGQASATFEGTTT